MRTIPSLSLSFKLALFTLPGAILGAYSAINISNQLFEKNSCHCNDWCNYNNVIAKKTIESVENLN